MRTLWVSESDTHGGNKFGLMNPAVELDEIDVGEDGEEEVVGTYTPTLTQAQKELWALRETNMTTLQSIAANYDKVIYSHNGDVTQGIKHPAALVSTRQADQISIAVSNMVPLMELPETKTVRFASGTEAHNFGQATSDILVEKLLSAMYPEKNIKVRNHGFATLEDGFTVDYGHHGPHPGTRSWLMGNVARFYLRDIMMNRIAAGLRPPDLVIRSHFHTPIWETLRYGGFTSHIVITPSMCMVDDHTLQAVRSPESVTCGMMAFDIYDGKLIDLYQYTKSFSMLQEEKL